MTYIAPPSPELIRSARKSAGLTQTAAGALVCCPLSTWQEWEYGGAAMPPGLWDLFKIKAASGLGPAGTVSPPPAQVKAARLDLGLTQAQCAALVNVAHRTWQSYEYGGQSKHARAMPPGLWELFKIKTALKP